MISAAEPEADSKKKFRLDQLSDEYRINNNNKEEQRVITGHSGRIR